MVGAISPKPPKITNVLGYMADTLDENTVKLLIEARPLLKATNRSQTLT